VKTPEEVASNTSKELAKFGVEPISQVEVIDPITKEKRIVTLDRTGHTEAKLITALADANLSRDRKDHELSMYLFTRGAEGASFMLDLARYKGEHVKETRVFKSQIRFDFEALVDILADHLEMQARRTEKMLSFKLEDWTRGYRNWLNLSNNKAKELTVWEWLESDRAWRDSTENRLQACLISQAIFDFSEAQRLRESRTRIARAREAEKGGGIYVGKDGKVYSVNDEEVDAIIKADREATQEIEKE